MAQNANPHLFLYTDPGVKQIHDLHHGIHMLVLPGGYPKEIARVVIVTAWYHCCRSQVLRSTPTLQLCCN